MAALWASTTTKMDAAVANSVPQADDGTLGQLMQGRPLGTLPSVATPCAERSAYLLTTMDPMTAISAQGMRLASRPPITMMPITEIETANVAQLTLSQSAKVL